MTFKKLWKASTDLPRINRDDLILGMIVAEDVRDRYGRLLITEGTELTGKHLRLFKLWGLTGVIVYQPGKETVSSNNMEVAEMHYDDFREQVEQEMNSFFRYTDRNHPFINSLFQLCIHRKVHSGKTEDSIG